MWGYFCHNAFQHNLGTTGGRISALNSTDSMWAMICFRSVLSSGMSSAQGVKGLPFANWSQLSHFMSVGLSFLRVRASLTWVSAQMIYESVVCLCLGYESVCVCVCVCLCVHPSIHTSLSSPSIPAFDSGHVSLNCSWLLFSYPNFSLQKNKYE